MSGTCEKEELWNSDRHSYIWIDENGNFYVMKFSVDADGEHYKGTQQNSKVKGEE